LEGAPVGSAKPWRGVCGPARWTRKRRRASRGPDLVGGGAKAKGGAKLMLPIPVSRRRWGISKVACAQQPRGGEGKGTPRRRMGKPVWRRRRRYRFSTRPTPQ
ncbi:Os01g0508300, partial [Oryza sativa Japonica Group]